MQNHGYKTLANKTVQKFKENADSEIKNYFMDTLNNFV